MKQWEVMRLLEENPAKVYEAKMHCGHTTRMRVHDGYYRFEIFNGEALIGQHLGAGAFNGNAGLYLDWHEVKQPVTWQEAIQAWADGKKVSYKYPDDKVVYPFQDSNKMLSIEKIKSATWYVED